jgi:hypothetical protein
MSDYTATAGKVTVTLTDIGEGLSGDYNPKDPNDVPLYRADVFHDVGADLDLEDGDSESFCTCIRSDLTDFDYQALVQKAAEYAATWVEEHGSTRGAAARLSWWTESTTTSPFDKIEEES